MKTIYFADFSSLLGWSLFDSLQQKHICKSNPLLLASTARGVLLRKSKSNKRSHFKVLTRSRQKAKLKPWQCPPEDIAVCQLLVRALLVSASSAPSAAGLLAWASMLWEWWYLDLTTLITLRLMQAKNFRVKTEENSELMFETEINVVLHANDMSMTYQCQCQWHVIDLPPKKTQTNMWKSEENSPRSISEEITWDVLWWSNGG